MSVAMGDTFLTEPLAMDLPEPEAMIRVREEHSRLQGVVFSLNKKISQVLAKQEGDFLAAYRAHMYTVQKELQTLRQRVIEAENVLQVSHSAVRTCHKMFVADNLAAQQLQYSSTAVQAVVAVGPEQQHASHSSKAVAYWYLYVHTDGSSGLTIYNYIRYKPLHHAPLCTRYNVRLVVPDDIGARFLL